MTSSKSFAYNRRDFLKIIGIPLGGAVAGWGAVSVAKEASPALLRPPGAEGEEAFLAACIRCGLCVEACPYDTLRPAPASAAAAMGTPYLAPRETPCYLCQNYGKMRCIAACPTGALQPVEEKAAVRMGTAVINQSTCLAWNGIVCRACWHACPFPDAAIELDLRGRPIVHTNACVGCGICDHVCLTDPGSIAIVPAAVEEKV